MESASDGSRKLRTTVAAITRPTCSILPCNGGSVQDGIPAFQDDTARSSSCRKAYRPTARELVQPHLTFAFRVAGSQSCSKRGGPSLSPPFAPTAGPMWAGLPADHRKAATKHHTPCSTLIAAETPATRRTARGRRHGFPVPKLLRTRPAGGKRGAMLVGRCGAQHHATKLTRNLFLLPAASKSIPLKSALRRCSPSCPYCTLNALASVTKARAPVDLQFPRRLQLGVPWP
jgi:hypothetical protein